MNADAIQNHNSYALSDEMLDLIAAGKPQPLRREIVERQTNRRVTIKVTQSTDTLQRNG